MAGIPGPLLMIGRQGIQGLVGSPDGASTLVVGNVSILMPSWRYGCCSQVRWALGCVHFPGLSHSGSGSQVLHKGTDSVGSGFVPFPSPSSSGDQVLGERTLPGWGVPLITSPVPAILFSGCAVGAPSQVCHVSLLGSRSLAVTLLVDVNRPGSQEDLVSNWKPARSLVEDAISGAEFAPCLPALAITCLPASLPPAGDGPVCNGLSLLWYSLSPLFCEQAWQCLRLGLFVAKFSLFFFSLSLVIPQFGLLSHVSSLRLPSGHSGPVLILSNATAPPCTSSTC